MQKLPFWRSVPRWLRDRRLFLLFYVLFVAALLSVYGLYGFPWGLAGYTILLGSAIGALLCCVDFARYYLRASQLHLLAGHFPTGELPAPATLPEEQYHAIVRALEEERAALRAQNEALRQDSEQYYTLWAHQVKTPLAAMQLLLEAPDAVPGEATRTALRRELFRTGQYVDMVMHYQRLFSLNADLVLREHSVESLVKKAVKNCAPLFICKNLPVRLRGLTARFVTDEKWFCFVLEQILANAAKYTSEGGVTLYVDAQHNLCVGDTGIGIAPEDLPRVWERGFTGGIGRSHRESTGIGLYLCREICGRLGVPLHIDSEKGAGTTVRLGLVQQQLELE